MRRGLGKGLEELLAIYDREETTTSNQVSVEKEIVSKPLK